ncbi:MAG: rhodanese-like domain-containing protein [Bacteroidetes bacterium]|nr:rhodanese-like domain-containing protein [Bacteroidota bacterium]
MQKQVIIIICSTLICLSLGAQLPDTSKYSSLDPYYFHLQYLKEDSVLLIDVRQGFEYRANRIRDAVNMPFSSYLEIMSDTLPKYYALFLYCTDDYRSSRACEICYDLGYRKVYNLKGGLIAWRREGYPLEKKRIRKKDMPAFK